MQGARERKRERGIGGEDRLRKVENLNSGAVPPPRCDRRRLVSGDWLAAGKGVRDLSTGVEEIACSRGSCRLLRRRCSTISRVTRSCFLFSFKPYHLERTRSCRYIVSNE